MCLAIGGKFPGDYEDGRFSEPPAGLEVRKPRRSNKYLYCLQYPTDTYI